MSRRLSFLSFVGCLLSLCLHASELGRPCLQDFPLRAMANRGYQPGPPAYDNDGVMYFGNWSAVTTYDGTAWDVIEMPFARLVRGPARGPDGTLYVGGYNQLGYLRDAAFGKKEFVSLLDRLPEAARDFRDTRAVLPVSGGVVFVSDSRLLVWRDGKFTVVERPAGRVCGDGRTVYLQVAGQPLVRLEEGKFIPVSDDPLVTAGEMVGVERCADGSLLVGVARQGFVRLRDGRATPEPTALDPMLPAHPLTQVHRLGDGSLAVALQGEGVLILDAAGRLLTALNTPDEISTRGNTVRGFCTDREGGLWWSHATGVTRAEWPAGITYFNKDTGLDTMPLRAVARDADGMLYVAGAGGVSRLTGTDPAERAHFEKVPGLTEASGLLPDAGGLLVASATHLLQLTGGRFTPVLAFAPAASGPSTSLIRSRTDPRRVWIYHPGGVRSVIRDGAGWRDEGPVPGIDRAILNGVELDDGTLWLTKQVDGFLRVRFTPGDADPRGTARVEDFPGGQGLPAKLAANNNVLLWRGEPVFITDYSSFRRDEAAGRFVPFTAFGDRLNALPLSLSTVFSDRAGDLWISGSIEPPGRNDSRGRRLYHATTGQDWRQGPHQFFDTIRIPGRFAFWDELDRAEPVLWIGGTDGLARLEARRLEVAAIPFPIRLQAEAIHDGQLWSDERVEPDVTDPRAPAKPAAAGDPSLEIRPAGAVPAASTSYRFRFAAVTQRSGADVRYQTRLEGFESDWTAPTPDRSRTFTSLSPGHYVFHVRATTSDDFAATPTQLAFSVLSPWWRTSWAYAAYGLLFLTTVAGLMRLRSRQLRRANERLEALVLSRTEELRANEQQLRLARDGAEAASRAKTSFLANMSHELRTPLNAVLGYAQIMQRDSQLSPDHQRRVGAIAQGGEHLLRMINEILDLSKIEADKVEVHPHPLPLPRLLAAVTEMFQMRASQKGLAFSHRQTTPLPEIVFADEGRLRQVLINLIENAVKFTPAGGRVDLEVGRQGERIRFAVRDTGPGIAAGEVDRIFQPFHQAASAGLRQQGAGLGLAISQRLAGLMGGVIRVENVPGGGSLFSFDLALPELAPGQSRDPFARRRTGYTGPRRRVLVADDEETNRHVLREMLEPLGFLLTEAADGATAVAQVRQTPPDLLLMDIRMPRLDGLAATEQIRRLPGGHAVKIAAVSASVFSSDRTEAMARGCDDFLPKPFREDHLLDVIGRLLRLDWRHEAVPAGSPAAATRAYPSRRERARLAALAEEGDVAALRAQVKELRRRHPEAGAWLDGIDALAAGFQMIRVGEEIARLTDEDDPAG